MRECSFKQAKWDRDNPPNNINVYTDASSRKVGDYQWESSWAFVIVRAKYLPGTSYHFMPDTDEVIAEFSGIGNLPTNAAELFAFGQALSYCMLYLNPFNANFRMDSELVKQWLKGEKRIKSHVVLPIYNRVFPLYEAALGNGGKFHPVRIMHVKGHSGNEMNERADALAGEANANRDGEYLEDFLVDAENRFMRRLEFKSMQDLLVEFSQTAAVLDSLSAQTNNILGFDHDVSVDLRHATDAFTRVFQAVSSEDVE